MARPRKPSNILKLRGSFRRNPQRARTDPEPAGELGDPPAHLSADETQCWRELEAMASPGVLTAGDRWVVEIGARLMCEYREVKCEFQAAKLTRLHAVLGSLGMSPSDRSKVVARPARGEPADDPWDL